MLEELTTPIKHGQLSWEEAILHQSTLCSESPWKKAQDTCSREVSQSTQVSSFSGQLSAQSIPLKRTSSSSCGCIKISATTGLNSVWWALPSCLLQPSPILYISPEKWLTSGPRKEVDTAPGITATESAQSGWLSTWISYTSTIWPATQGGSRDTVFSTSSPSGWLIISACSLTAMKHGLL